MAKYAFCVGINDYPGTSSDLSGCENDACDWADTLKQRGFDVTLVLNKEATKARLVEGITRLIETTDGGDTAVLTYSGHGSWMPDDDEDERDGRDEALCPYDFQKGLLLDDELYELFTQRKRGSRLVFISDSCHSGTLAKAAEPLGDEPRRVRFLAPSHFLPPNSLPRARAVERNTLRGRSRSSALLLAGCRDLEFSYDAQFKGKPNGAFTYVALQELRKLGNGSTYAEWMKNIRRRLPSLDYPQQPCIDGTSAQRKWRIFE